MRFQITKGINNNYLLTESKGFDPASINALIESFKQFDWRTNKVLIISGDSLPSEEIQDLLSQYLLQGYLSECILIGSETQSKGFKHFPTIDHFISSLKVDPIFDSAIFITGSSSKHTRYVKSYLADNAISMILSVDLGAISHNIEFYRNKTKPRNKVMAMVKANAYGHGLVEVAQHLKNQVDYFGVAYVNEGITLRREGISTPIMVMNPSKGDLELCVDYKLEPEIYSLYTLDQLQKLLLHKKVSVGVHIEIDTGMNRLGITPSEVDQLIQILQTSEFIRIHGIYSHLACAEDANEDAFNRKQLEEFNTIAAKIESALDKNTIKHIRNSAGTLRYPSSPTDMIRLGIGMYGVDSNNMYQDQIKNISCLKTTISQIRTVRKGETIGYNRTFKAPKDMIVATIAIGYADGFKRLFSNGRGQVMINGMRVTVVGRVNMDMTMVDISNCTAKEGDEVIIFNEVLKPTDLAKKAETIPYEIFTSVGERVRRSYLLEIG